MLPPYIGEEAHPAWVGLAVDRRGGCCCCCVLLPVALLRAFIRGDQPRSLRGLLLLTITKRVMATKPGELLVLCTEVARDSFSHSSRFL